MRSRKPITVVISAVALFGLAHETMCAPISEEQFKTAAAQLAQVYAVRAKLEQPAEKQLKDATEQLTKVKAALPEKAQVQPAQARRLLIFTRTAGFRHSSIELGAQTVAWLGQQTGAYESTVSDDIEMFAPDKLKAFDAVCMVSTTQDIFLDKGAADQEAARKRAGELEQSLRDYVTSGKGWAGIHAAGDMGDSRPEYRAMVGGTFQSHPWHEKVTVRVEEPRDAATAAFTEPDFEITDEIYLFKEPYSREKQRILLSLDMTKTAPKGNRKDNDYAVSWVKSYGQGRVFYSSLGHREEIFWNPLVLKHYLDGIQFALGDLKVDTTPHALPAGAATPGSGGSPAVGAAPNATPAAVSDIPDEPTDALMGDYVGTYLPSQQAAVSPVPVNAQVIAEGNGTYRVVLLAPATEAGGKPRRIEVPAKMENDKLVSAGKVGDTDWKVALEDGRLKLSGGGEFELRKTMRRSPTLGLKPPPDAVVLLPFDANKAPALDAWTNKEWKALSDGSMLVTKGDNRTTREFGDMQLHLEYRPPFMPDARGQGRANSGIYFQDRYEVQVLDSFGLEPRDNEAGGIYQVAVPKTNAALPPATWQTYDVIYRAPRLKEDGSLDKAPTITVYLNGVKIHDKVEIPRSTGGAAGANFVAKAPLRLQDHRNPMRFRNTWVKELNGDADVAAAEAALEGQMNAAAEEAKAGWRTLFNGTDLTGWKGKAQGGPRLVDGTIYMEKGTGDIWTEEQFGDFVLDLEFKLDKGTNSGIFIRNPKPGDWYAGQEIAIQESFGKEKPGRHDTGANYDVLAPTKSMVKAPGEWNRMIITAIGPRIQVSLNGEQVLDQDLDQWTEAGKNPDGTTNKFKKAYKDMPRRGHIELQEHGNPIWYRNIKIKALN